MPRAVQPADASLARPTEARPPVRHAQLPLEAARVRAPEKRLAPHQTAATTDPSPFEAARAKRVRVSEEAREVTRDTRGERRRPFVHRNIRRRRMP